MTFKMMTMIWWYQQAHYTDMIAVSTWTWNNQKTYCKNKVLCFLFKQFSLSKVSSVGTLESPGIVVFLLFQHIFKKSLAIPLYSVGTIRLLLQVHLFNTRFRFEKAEQHLFSTDSTLRKSAPFPCKILKKMRKGKCDISIIIIPSLLWKDSFPFTTASLSV